MRTHALEKIHCQFTRPRHSNISRQTPRTRRVSPRKTPESIGRAGRTLTCPTLTHASTTLVKDTQLTLS